MTSDRIESTMPELDAGFIDIDDERGMAIVRDPVRSGILEVIRRHRRGASLADLAATGIGARQLAACLNDLMSAGLISRRPARRGSAVRYQARCERITIVANPARPEHVRAVRAAFKDATRDVAQALEESDAHDGKIGATQRLIDIRLKLDFRPEEWTEFMRRLRAVYDYAQVVSESRGGTATDRMAACDHVLAIRLVPTRAPMLPAPTIRHASQEQIRAAQATDPGSMRQYDDLSSRERQVVALLAAGMTRPRIAIRLGVSVNTVSTLVRRAYQKLDVTSRAQLQFRLARIRGRHGTDGPGSA
jgi:DNA-binding CsgD family transcriptional regulator